MPGRGSGDQEADRGVPSAHSSHPGPEEPGDEEQVRSVWRVRGVRGVCVCAC